MAILDFTTKVPVETTASEIQKILVKAGAHAVMNEFNRDGQISQISFRIDTKHGTIAFCLPANVNGVHAVLQRKGSVDRPSYRTYEHAEKVAWRIVKDWVEAQMAIINAQMAELPQVFLPYAQTSMVKRFIRFLINAVYHY